MASMPLSHLKPNIFGTYAINRKILENKMTGIAEINPSRMALKYMLRDNFSKNGFPFSICAINFCIIVITLFYKILINASLNLSVKLLSLNGLDHASSSHYMQYHHLALL